MNQAAIFFLLFMFYLFIFVLVFLRGGGLGLVLCYWFMSVSWYTIDSRYYGFSCHNIRVQIQYYYWLTVRILNWCRKKEYSDLSDFKILRGHCNLNQVILITVNAIWRIKNEMGRCIGSVKTWITWPWRW